MVSEQSRAGKGAQRFRCSKIQVIILGCGVSSVASFNTGLLGSGLLMHGHTVMTSDSLSFQAQSKQFARCFANLGVA